MREKLISKTSGTPSAITRKNIKEETVKIISLIGKIDSKLSLSLELCPDRDLDPNLLACLNSRFCSVTWMGQNLHNVDEISALNFSKRLIENDYNVLLHLVGRSLSREIALEVLMKAQNFGIKNILALQGDPSLLNKQDKGDFKYASDLVKFVKEKFGDYFCIGVAGYPEKHPDSRSTQEDLYYLKQKVDAGADFILTQACFKHETIEKFVVNCRELSVNVPIIAGIFVITSHNQLMRITEICRIAIPADILEFVTKNEGNAVIVEEYGMALATESVKKILGNPEKFAGVHVFTLNKLEVVQKLFAAVS